MNLSELLEQVEDERTFIVFVKTLIKDREEEVSIEKKAISPKYSAGARGWENGSIETYLDAAVSWAEDTNWGETVGMGDTSSWKKIACFLYAGKIYE